MNRNAILCHTAEQWHATRATGIGASEAPAVHGLSPWGGPLSIYADKLNPPGQKDTDATRAGLLLEETIARIHARSSGTALIVPTDWLGDPFAYAAVWYHPDRGFELATPDRIEIVDEGPEDERPAEFKTVGPHMAHHWKDGVPAYVRVQVQQQMDVMGAETAVVRALFLTDETRSLALALADEAKREGSNIANILEKASEGWPSESWVLERDDAFLADHAKALAELWERIQERRPPEADVRKEDVAKLLARVWPEEDPSKRVDLSHNYGHLLAELYQIQDRRKAAEQREAAIKAEIQGLMGDAAEAVYGGQTVAKWVKQVRNYAAREATQSVSRVFTLSRKRVPLGEHVVPDLPDSEEVAS